MIPGLGWLWSGLCYVLDSLNFRNKTAKLVFIGIDNAGKTTLLFTLKERGRIGAMNPTWQPTNEELQIGGISFTTWDLGGHEQARKLWKSYLIAVDGIVFIVDAAAQDRLPEVRKELNNLLADPEVADVPVLVLGNKIDKPEALTEDELKTELKLHGQTTGKSAVKSGALGGARPMELFMCTILNKSGYGDGLRWLAKYV